MADNKESDQIAEFRKVTGADENRARHYLEASGWNSDLAVSNFYETEDGIPDDNENAFQPTANPVPESGAPTGPNQANRFAAIDALLNANAEEEESEEEGEAFYAGGSVRSGQQVLGPSKRKSGNSIAADLFRSLREHGAEPELSDQRPKMKLKAFGGTGHVLGHDTATSSAVPSRADAPQTREVRLRLWRQGFTVDDGPMREFSDPVNKMFLDSVRRGEVPEELRRLSHSTEIHISIEDKTHDEYMPKKACVNAFTGAGFRLGNVTPAVTSNSNKPTEKEIENAQEHVKVDDSRPVTSVQIRLFDGSRLVMQANHDHTISDVRRFIINARPEHGNHSFALLTSFPVKELTDDSATLESMNLLNSVIVQKPKS